MDPDRFRFPSTREWRGSQTDFYCNSCHQDGTKVRCAYLRHVLARPERHSRLTTVCKPPQRRPNATSLFADFVYSRAEGRAISAAPLSFLRSGPRLIVKVYFGWLMTGFSISPTHRQRAHDIASHRHTPRKGHDSGGPPDSGNSHVFSRPSSHSFRDSVEDFLPLVASPPGSRLGKKQTLAAHSFFFVRHELRLVTLRTIQRMCDSFWVPGAHARNSR